MVSIDDILGIGNKIEMHEINTSMRKNNLNDEPERIYISQLLEFDEEDEELLSIAMPIYEGKLIPLETGRRFDLYFYAQKGIYACCGEIVNRYKSNNIYVLVVRLTTELKKHQRRQYFRLETNIEVQYKVFTKDEEKYYHLMGKISDDMENRPYTAGVSIDISGGGIRFVAKEGIEAGSKVLISINPSSNGVECSCRAVAKVISSGKSRGKENVFENRIEFVDIKDNERERLIKYIFNEERNQRKRRME